MEQIPNTNQENSSEKPIFEQDIREQLRFLQNSENKGEVPAEVAFNLILEKGGGYPDTVLESIDKFSQLDVQKLVDHMLSFDHHYALVRHWGVLQEKGVDTEALLEKLISMKMSFFPETLKTLGNGRVGPFINRLAEAGYSGQALKSIVELAEEETLSPLVLKKMQDAELPETIKYCQSKNLFIKNNSFQQAA